MDKNKMDLAKIVSGAIVALGITAAVAFSANKSDVEMSNNYGHNVVGNSNKGPMPVLITDKPYSANQEIKVTGKNNYVIKQQVPAVDTAYKSN